MLENSVSQFRFISSADAAGQWLAVSQKVDSGNHFALRKASTRTGSFFSLSNVANDTSLR
jgi:hypothetical protein